MAKAQDWQTRLTHEASQHDASSFLTLTYSDEHLPPDYSLCVRDLQLFMKRFRKSMEPERLRFFAVGEYGDVNLRPHYHAIIFGYDFPDKYYWRRSPAGYPLYRSPELEKLWTLGNAEIGSVTPESSGYVARYCLQKVNGFQAPDHYSRHNPYTGEVTRVKPEFIVSSRRPGIGGNWLEKYGSTDLFPSDFVVIDGSKKPVPAYYLRKQVEQVQLEIKKKRQEAALQRQDNNTPERLAVREEVLRLRAINLKREL